MEIRVGDLIHNSKWGDKVPPIEVIKIIHFDNGGYRIYYNLENASEDHVVESKNDAWYETLTLETWTIVKRNNNLKNLKGYGYEDRRQSKLGSLS